MQLHELSLLWLKLHGYFILVSFVCVEKGLLHDLLVNFQITENLIDGEGAAVSSLGPTVAPVLRSMTSKVVSVEERGNFSQP